MASVTAAFDRLSRREKVLVSTLFGVLFGSVIVLATLWFGSSIGDLQDKIEDDRTALKKIYKSSGAFLEQRQSAERMRTLAERNEDLNLKLAVNEIAKSINFQSRNRRGEVEGNKKLADVMQFDQTQETFLSKKKRKARKDKDKKEADAGYFRRDQPITLSDTVTFDAIYELMEKIEASSQMLYVTDLEMTRDFQDGRVARKNATIVVSTFYYRGGESQL